MPRVWSRITGGGSGGVIIPGDLIGVNNYLNKVKENIDMAGLGALHQNVFAGGDEQDEIQFSADGDYDLKRWMPPISIPNVNSQFSSFVDAHGGVFVARFRFYLRVSDPAIAATPKMRYGTTEGALLVAGTGTAATYTGALACSAVNLDFTGVNQIQVLDVTLPASDTFWKPQLTITGTGGLAYSAAAIVRHDLFIRTT